MGIEEGQPVNLDFWVQDDNQSTGGPRIQANALNAFSRRPLSFVQAT